MDRNHHAEAAREGDYLVEQALDGNREALNQLLAIYRVRLYRQALRIVGNPEDAEDAIQDAFLSAVRHLDQFEGRSKFVTWLTRVVINAAAMIRRRKLSRLEASLERSGPNDEEPSCLEIADLKPSPEQVCSSFEIRVLLNEQFKTLSPGLRSAFRLRHVEGLSCAEAGETLGISVSAVKSRIARAKRQLAENLNHAYREPLGTAQYDLIAARGEIARRNLPAT
ncbi:MAG TPA: RNA polymerase sigma factor [Verrucomicrobiae bacterium]|nr:RNA polymerase sigma factor [Verrucomicrobiae bacterium]